MATNSILQATLISHGGTQCGFCTPGIVLSVMALLEQNSAPSDREIRHAIAGNLYRAARLRQDRRGSRCGGGTPPRVGVMTIEPEGLSLGERPLQVVGQRLAWASMPANVSRAAPSIRPVYAPA